VNTPAKINGIPVAWLSNLTLDQRDDLYNQLGDSDLCVVKTTQNERSGLFTVYWLTESLAE
jgi:hypothetical protein